MGFSRGEGHRLMEWNATITTFGLIFLAEMGDKTQLAVLSMAAGTDAPWSVFVGAAVALCLVSLLGFSPAWRPAVWCLPR